MTRPVCEVRAKAWDSMTREQHAEIDATPDDMVRPLACLIACDRPRRLRSGGGRCGGYTTGETDRCVCDDATPRVDVSALLAERDRLRVALGQAHNVAASASRNFGAVIRERDAARACVASLLTHIDGARCPWHPEHVDTCADCALFKTAREMGGST